MKNNNASLLPTLGGYCTSPALFVKKTGKPDPFGIISEQIFGPVISYHCSCGFLRHRTLDNGQRCPKCGTMCISNESRLTTFGKIKTLFPFIKLTHKNDIIQIIGKENKQLLDPKLLDSNLALNKFICVNPKQDIIVINDSSKVPTGYTIIPFKIIGIFSLIFIFRYLGYVLQIKKIQDIFENNYINDEIDVLPVDTRPVFKNSKKVNSLFYEEINKFYISIINSNNRNKLINPTIEEDQRIWAEKITEKLKNKDYSILDVNTIEYEQISTFYQFYVDAIYEWCFTKIRGKQGIIRSSILSRTLEFSARTVITVDPSIKPYELKTPRSTLFSLWLPYFLNYVTSVKHYMKYDESYYQIASKRYNDLPEHIHNYFIEFLDWFTNSEEAAEVVTMPHNAHEKINIRQISWWNRQPSLWSHSAPAQKLIPRNDEEFVLGVNPLSIEPLNAVRHV